MIISRKKYNMIQSEMLRNGLENYLYEQELLDCYEKIEELMQDMHALNNRDTKGSYTKEAQDAHK